MDIQLIALFAAPITAVIALVYGLFLTRNVLKEEEGSEKLRKAAENLSKSPASIHLRTLQTIREIAQDPSEKVIILVPSDFGEIVKKFVK